MEDTDAGGEHESLGLFHASNPAFVRHRDSIRRSFVVSDHKVSDFSDNMRSDERNIFGVTDAASFRDEAQRCVLNRSAASLPCSDANTAARVTTSRPKKAAFSTKPVAVVSPFWSRRHVRVVVLIVVVVCLNASRLWSLLSR